VRVHSGPVEDSGDRRQPLQQLVIGIVDEPRGGGVDGPQRLITDPRSGLPAGLGMLGGALGPFGQELQRTVHLRLRPVRRWSGTVRRAVPSRPSPTDRKSTRLNSSHVSISYAV